MRFLQKLTEFRLKCIESNKYFEELERNEVHEIPIDVQQISDEMIKVELFPVVSDQRLVNSSKSKPKLDTIEDHQSLSKVRKRKKPEEKENTEKFLIDKSFENSRPPLFPSESYICPICTKTFRNKYSFNSHQRIHEEGKFECHFCTRKFHRKQFLLSHLLARHVEKDFGRTGDYTCDICHKRYLNSFRLNRHKEIHTKNLAPCSVCAKMVKNMTSHMRTHETSGQRFQCDQCGKNYKAQKDLISHKIVHENKIFACEECGKEFNQPSKVQQHMRIHKPDRPKFPCHHCNHHFSFKSALLEHLRCNTGERRFVCTVCSFAFKKASALKKHMHTHNGTKPYMCGQCSYGSKNKREYLEHVKMMHGK